MTLEQDRDAYLIERPIFQRLAARVAEVARVSLFHAGIPCRAEHRAKDMSEVLKKVIKGLKYKKIYDRAGARAVMFYPNDRNAACEVIRKSFQIDKENDRSKDLKYDQFGYRGLNIVVRLHDVDVGEDREIADRQAELQLVTPAEHLWGTVSHPLDYKAGVELPGEVRRVIHRLSALGEVVDEQIVQARLAVEGTVGFKESQLLRTLERHFFRFAARDYDRELSVILLRDLARVVDDSEVATFAPMIDAFCAKHEGQLSRVYVDYRNDDRNPILFQPEALLVFWALSRDAFRTVEQWPASLPESIMRSFAAIWGVELPEAS